jgi:hypothetical protein
MPIFHHSMDANKSEDVKEMIKQGFGLVEHMSAGNLLRQDALIGCFCSGALWNKLGTGGCHTLTKGAP